MLGMQNFYVRKHLLSVPPPSPFFIEDVEDASMSHLHLNINSFSKNCHRCYSDERAVEALMGEYLRILPSISNLGSTQELLLADQALFTRGSAEAIDLLIRSYCEPRQEAIITTPPTFPYYAERALLENVKIYEIPLQGSCYSELDVEAILSTPSKLLFLCSPNNPVGTVLQREQVEHLLQTYSGLIVVDEAYIEWSREPSYIALLSTYPNLIVLRTFSKIWGLAGIRSGVAIGHPSILRPLRTLQPMLSFPSFSQSILKEAIRDYLCLAKYRVSAELCRNDLSEWLRSSSFVQKIFPSHANFLLVQCVRARELAQYLQQNKVFVKDVSKAIPDSLRISLGTEQEMVRLKMYMSNFYQGGSL